VLCFELESNGAQVTISKNAQATTVLLAILVLNSNGAHLVVFIPRHNEASNNPIFINEQIHKNAQATTVLLASLCKDEYNKVSGLDNAKQIWDTLKISHEGNDATMITKMELVEGELGRFAMIRGEEPTQTYNRLKTLVNKIRSYGSTRWTDHDAVRLMLR
jgi:hypothetical protein